MISSTSLNPSTSSIKIRIAIVTTHPIQYNAPLFGYLASIGEFSVKIFYTWGKNSIKVFDPGFGKERSWDIDLLSGYEYLFVENTSKNPGSDYYNGIINPDLIKQVTTFNPNAIIVYGWKFNSHLKLMRYFKGRIPILFRGDSTLLDEQVGFTFKKSIRQLFLKWVYKHVDYALSPGRASDDYFEYAGLKKIQIVRAAHAIDNERFSGLSNESLSEDSWEWRNELGIPKEAITFLFAGKFEPKKNPLLLIRAFKKLYETNKNIHIILVGDGVMKNQIIRELKNSTLFASISTILPFQNQSKMPSVYRLGDIFILPSAGPGETWGLAVNEAMASKRYVLVSDKCGCSKDIIQRKEEGLIFESNNLDDLLLKMKESILIIQRLKTCNSTIQNSISNFSFMSFRDALFKILHQT